MLSFQTDVPSVFFLCLLSPSMPFDLPLGVVKLFATQGYSRMETLEKSSVKMETECL